MDILVQSRRNKQAAKRFFRKRLKGLRDVPRVIITDQLKSDEAARKERIPGVEHRQHKGLNNRAELSHQPTYLRNRQAARAVAVEAGRMGGGAIPKRPRGRRPRDFTLAQAGWVASAPSRRP